MIIIIAEKTPFRILNWLIIFFIVISFSTRAQVSSSIYIYGLNEIFTKASRT